MAVRSWIVPLTLAAILIGPAVAEAFSSRKGGRVNPVTPQVFEVIPRDPVLGAEFWCAAGDYARRALGAPWAAPVYIYRGRSVSVTTGRRSAVQFTLDAGLAGNPEPGRYGSQNSLRRGDNMPVQRAANYCNELPLGF
ncbi:hypothetical protein ACUXV3_08525 [Roseobacteraceae bacterium NS-SX3]